jgi:hypothetical protein
MDREAQQRYAWMALAAFLVVAAGRMLLPFSGQQRAQNISLATEAIVGATLGLMAFRLLRRRKG